MQFGGVLTRCEIERVLTHLDTLKWTSLTFNRRVSRCAILAPLILAGFVNRKVLTGPLGPVSFECVTPTVVVSALTVLLRLNMITPRPWLRRCRILPLDVDIRPGGTCVTPVMTHLILGMLTCVMCRLVGSRCRCVLVLLTILTVPLGSRWLLTRPIERLIVVPRVLAEHLIVRRLLKCDPSFPRTLSVLVSEGLLTLTPRKCCASVWLPLKTLWNLRQAAELT